MFGACVVAEGAPVTIGQNCMDHHDTIWAIQKPLDVPRYVYNLSRPPEGSNNMQEVTKRRSELLGKHVKDRVVRQSTSRTFVTNAAGPVTLTRSVTNNSTKPTVSSA
jgi:hypothetical protein